MRIKIFGYTLLISAFLMQSFLFGISPVHAEDTEVVHENEPVQSTLIISAVQITGGTGKTQEEFIELFNPTSEPFNLNGHRLVKRTAAGITDVLIKSWEGDTIVEPNHFFLWANIGFTTINLTPDATSTVTLADNNGIALRNGPSDSGSIIDSLAWGSTANGFENKSSINPGANESLVITNLFEEVAEFVIQASNPRNTSVIFQPENVPDEDISEDEEPVDEPEEENEENISVKITEILPNPAGDDSGFEKVELYNSGTARVYIEGYKLDDIAPAEFLSSNAYTLPNLEIAPGSYLSITIPAGSLSLNNTGGDILSLFNASGVLMDPVFYEGSSPEAKSYSYFENGWQWSEPTFGAENVAPIAPEDESESEDEDEDEYDNSGLEVSEIFPQPDSSGTEFVEIYNSGAEAAQLSEVDIYVGERRKQLPEYELKPGDYFIANQDALPIQLRNSGQTIKLQEGSTVLSTVAYPLAIINASFAKFEDGYLWTTEVTRAEANVLEIPETVKKEVATTASKTAVKKPSTPATKTAAKSSVSKAAASGPAKPQSAKINDLTAPTEDREAPLEEAVKKQKESLGKIIAMGAAAVVAGVTALYKLVFTSGVE